LWYLNNNYPLEHSQAVSSQTLSRYTNSHFREIIMLSKKSTFAALLVASCLAAQIVHADEATLEQGLPLQQISLFSSGVGYFERGGNVNGDATIELNFQRDGLNDVLKSLIASDPSGQLRPATYSLPELLQQAQTNNLPVPADQTLGDILRGFQGAQIEVTTDGKTIRGQLISVARKSITNEKDYELSVDVASILTDDGFQTVRLDKLENGGKVLLLDPVLNNKLVSQLKQQALKLASSVDDSYIPVTLHFVSKGKRNVQVGYIQSTSVWKTSYRLAFDSAKTKSADVHPLLQGWAVVENTTNEDWNNVGLNLIAGTPVSFTMNMAAPLFVRRAEIGVPFAGTLASQVYGESMEGSDREHTKVAQGLLYNGQAPMASATRGAVGPEGSISSAVSGGGGMAGPMGPSGKTSDEVENNRLRAELRDATAILRKQRANTRNAERGELFEYAIDQPISLKRGEASMIPIVSQAIDGEKFSIFDTRDSDLHAVNGLRITNSTKLHLAGGPLTIYEDGTYAGDAQITDIAPGENRLISYSLDGDLVISRKDIPGNTYLMGFSIKNGVLSISRKQRVINAYDLHNKADAEKKVLVLQPITNGFELIEPAKPSEKAKDEYRFEVPVAAGKTTEFKTVTERTYSETAALLNTNIDTLLVYSQNEKISPKLKSALEEIVRRRNALTDIQNQRKAVQDQIKNIEDDQNRIRQNMNSLPRDSDLFKSYMAKLTTQESQLENLRQQVAKLQEAETAANKALSDYVQNLNIES
jgi:hypothetical protein